MSGSHEPENQTEEFHEPRRSGDVDERNNGWRRRSEDNGLGKLLKFWPVLVGLVLVVGAFSVLKDRSETQASTITESKGQLLNHETRISKVEQAIVSMAESQQDMRKDVRELLRRVK